MMKRTLVLSIALLLVATAINAQSPNLNNSQNSILVTFDYEQITVDNTAGGKGFTASKINPTVSGGISARTRAQLASCSVETAQIRVSTNSGTTVSSTVGTIIDVGQSFSIYGYDDISTFRAIRTTSTSASISCHYSRLR